MLATPNSREGVSHGIIVELITPSDSFWGVNLQVKKTSVELQKLEKSLQAEGIDFRLLNEFRDTVDTLRTTALAVQQLREFQLKGRDDGEIVSMLVADRVRRATNLCHELVADIDAGKMSRETKEVDELLRFPRASVRPPAASPQEPPSGPLRNLPHLTSLQRASTCLARRTRRHSDSG